MKFYHVRIKTVQNGLQKFIWYKNLNGKSLDNINRILDKFDYKYTLFDLFSGQRMEKGQKPYNFKDKFIFIKRYYKNPLPNYQQYKKTKRTN